MTKSKRNRPNKETTATDEAKKKQKKPGNADARTLSKVWEHFCSFLDSQEEEEGGTDYDFLHEIIQELQHFHVPKFLEEVNLDRIEKFADDSAKFEFPNIVSLLPILMSVVYFHLAEEAMAIPHANPEEYFHESLGYFPLNAATLYTYANYQRMQCSSNLEEICRYYELASRFGSEFRNIAKEILQNEQKGDNEEEQNRKEWVDGLLLHEMVRAISFDDDEDEDDNDHHLILKETMEDDIPQSSIEANSEYMAALLRSTLQQHGAALQHLQKLDFTHRIHPNVWTAANQTMSKNTNDSKKISCENVDDDIPLLFTPKLFSDDVISEEMYDQLVKVFGPTAPFWQESDYYRRGYYSFFESITEDSICNPRHLVDDLVLNHLLPLTKSVTEEKIEGYEFWAHTRPLKANLGHQLHFDTDESLLNETGKVTHPVISSILYLTGSNVKSTSAAGSTIVFNQTPDSTQNANKVWVSPPKDKHYMIFPGNLLHGVLPCTVHDQKHEEKEASLERLTLMVGFWTRNVPEAMKDRQLYGPCGPIPPENDEHSWVKQIKNGYPRHIPNTVSTNTYEIHSTELICVAPAWESIQITQTPLVSQVPYGLDHRYFVKNAPRCFRESMFSPHEEN